MRIYLITILLLTHILPCVAQENEQAIISEIEAAYNNLNYTEAKIKARSALDNYERFSADQLATIHKIQGLIDFSENRQAEARTEFRSALELDPTLRLDPLYVSPKILEFFEKVRTETENQVSAADVRTRYVLVKDPRLGAAWRSMLFPGWGQRHKGEKRKGLVFSAVWLTVAGGTIASHIAHLDARERYAAETNPDLVGKHYDTMNKWYKVRNNLAVASVGIYLYSYLDALFKGVPDNYGSKKALNLTPSIAPGFQGIAIRFAF